MLKNLMNLDLRVNELNGTVPEILGQLHELVYLDLGSNELQGELVEAHFAGLARLERLDVSRNNLSLSMGSNWSPPPLLRGIDFSYCNVGPQFPTWLQKLRNVSYIGMRRSGISGVMPDWFWNFSSVMGDIDMSGNAIKGRLPSSLEHLDLYSFDLRDNQLEGLLPLFSSGLRDLDISNNSLSGVIPLKFWKKASSLQYVRLSANNLSGSIHPSSCKLKFLQVLDLSQNQLSGEIPNYWISSSILATLNLGNNKLSGRIPKSIVSLSSLQVLGVGNNNLSGRIPKSIGSLSSLHVLQVGNNNLLGSIPKSIGSLSSLQILQVGNNSLSGELPLLNCTSLSVLDLGNNNLSGNLSVWIGKNLKELRILRLRANMFTGTIPDELGSQLPLLSVVDLALNNLSGAIPQNFVTLTDYRFQQGNDIVASVSLDFRGRVDEYFIIAPTTIDLAGNRLHGVIPEEIATLYGLQNLNLSGNHLTGTIPKNISMLRQLESLNLSFNNLSGPIPVDMPAMSFLSHPNFSFNNLSGQIPFGGQFQSLLDPSIYTGNPGLCGYPLNVTCNDGGGGGASQTDDGGEERHNESAEIMWFYMTMPVGFVFGFWTFCGALLLNIKWCAAFFRAVDKIIDQVDVAMAVNLAKIRKYWFI